MYLSADVYCTLVLYQDAFQSKLPGLHKLRLPPQLSLSGLCWHVLMMPSAELLFQNRLIYKSLVAAVRTKPGPAHFLHHNNTIIMIPTIRDGHSNSDQPLCQCVVVLSFHPCRAAAGTLISEERDMKDALMTSIVLKPGITLLDIVSTRMLGQVGFMGTVFDIFNSNGISVDVVATSEVSISLTLDPR